MIPFTAPHTLGELAARHGGRLLNANDSARIDGIAPIEVAGANTLAPLVHARFAKHADAALARGAVLLVAEDVAHRTGDLWLHRHATWALAELLEDCVVPNTPPTFGNGCEIGENVVLMPRVTLGDRVRIEANSVIGRAGFGWAFGADGDIRPIPHLGGVIIEDDVTIGPLCTVDAGTLSPTIIRRGAKLDAHCHIAHNCEVGQDSILAAQTGLAGSVTIGRHVLVGGQVGIADHVTIGDGARIAAKSGVIGDVPAGAVVAGYPAVHRWRWLRGLAGMYKKRKPP